MTLDEELTKLEGNIRRLKIEYDAYFGGGLPRPPRETLFKVESAIKKFSVEAGGMSFPQRFRFNQLAQSYAVYSDLWRKRLQEVEEGREPGTRERAPSSLFRVVSSDPAAESEKVNQLFDVWMEAKRQMGEGVADADPAAFSRFISDRAAEIKRRLGCESVEFRVSVEDGKVKLKARRG